MNIGENTGPKPGCNLGIGWCQWRRSRCSLVLDEGRDLSVFIILMSYTEFIFRFCWFRMWNQQGLLEFSPHFQYLVECNLFSKLSFPWDISPHFLLKKWLGWLLVEAIDLLFFNLHSCCLLQINLLWFCSGTEEQTWYMRKSIKKKM